MLAELNDNNWHLHFASTLSREQTTNSILYNTFGTHLQPERINEHGKGVSCFMINRAD